MPVKRVVMVIDMQNGVFAMARANRALVCQRINQLIDEADHVVFIQHAEEEMQPGTHSFDLLPELHRPDGALYVTKTACDAFWHTPLEQTLAQADINAFVVCGCATDYCVDATIKNGVSRGYHITVAEDAHTTANRPAADAQILINHHNDVWRNFIAPANPLAVKRTETILENWKAN
mgnify:CR=1 FL=1